MKEFIIFQIFLAERAKQAITVLELFSVRQYILKSNIIRK